MDKVSGERASGKKRHRLQVIHDILSIISDHRNSIRPTPLMRYSNLSSMSFSEYCTELVEKELIKEVATGKRGKYLTLTDKGFRYLERYRLIIGLLDEFDL